MGVEILDAGFTQAPVKDVIKEESILVNDKDSGKLNQESGNQALDEPIKLVSHGEGSAVTNTNFPKDAVDEWPAPKQVHSFYFVKYRPYEDPKLKAKIDQLEKDLQKKNQARFEIVEALRAKRSERGNVISQLRPLTDEVKQYSNALEGKRKEMGPLHEALVKLRGTNNSNRGERGVSLCSSEKELNDVIQSLHYRIQHESNTLVEEKQLLREIKQLEGTRDKVIENAAEKAEIQGKLGQKEAIQDQVKLIGQDLDGVRKERQAVRGKIKVLEDELEIIHSEIASLEKELTAISERRDKTFDSLRELRDKRDDGNTCYYQNRKDLNAAKELAAKKDIAALEEKYHEQVENFISCWSSDESFRNDYEKRILLSLDMRQLSRDGRMRNPDEKPLVAVVPAPADPEIVAKIQTKRTKEETKPSVQHEAAPVRKVQKEDDSKLAEKNISTKASEVEDKENIITMGKERKEPVDAAKLKEMKREEEIAKAKLALERKKKLAEKAAAKAAIRAQKEAEKKLKEREKKAKKKAAASAPTINLEEQTEADAEAFEPENVNASVEVPVSSKKELKENTIKYRSRGKGQDPLPKIILKRKKSTPYWVWAAPAAVLFLMLAVLVYYYIL